MEGGSPPATGAGEDCEGGAGCGGGGDSRDGRQGEEGEEGGEGEPEEMVKKEEQGQKAEKAGQEEQAGAPGMPGRFLRPKAAVLEDEAVIPPKNLISPAPNQFTHQLTRETPFRYAGARAGERPDGVLPAGTKVVLLVYEGGLSCRVADSRGLYVEVEYSALRKL